MISKKWLRNYELAKNYYEEHGNLLIPSNYIIQDIKLGNWINTQRKAYKNFKNNKKDTHKIKKEQIDLLNSIKMEWSNVQRKVYDDNWMSNYMLAKKYFIEHNNLLIPYSYEMKDEMGEKIKLGIWIATQRNSFKNNNSKNLSSKKIDLLNEIGMVWLNVKRKKKN